MRDDIVLRFLRLPFARRKRALRHGDARLRSSHERGEWTKEGIASFCLEERIISIDSLRLHRKNNSLCPPMSAIIREYGSWLEMKKELFPELFSNNIIQTPEQVVEMVSRVPVRSWREYQRQRRVNPGIFPSFPVMKKWFGSWENLKRLACARQLTNIMSRYIILKTQLGRWPTNKECYEAGVEIDYALNMMKNRSALREMVVLLERQNNANRV